MRPRNNKERIINSLDKTIYTLDHKYQGKEGYALLPPYSSFDGYADGIIALDDVVVYYLDEPLTTNINLSTGEKILKPIKSIQTHAGYSLLMNPKGTVTVSDIGAIPASITGQSSLFFNAEVAALMGDDQTANTLYFRDSDFNRVAATFSRSTTATRVNSSGLIEEVAANVPRIDYTDGSAKLLMEPSRTNYFLNNGDADNGNWSKFNVVKNGDYNDGKITGVIGRRYGPSGAGLAAGINRTGTGSGLAGEITFSYIVKYAGWRWVELTTTQDPDISRVWFDLENGVKGTDADNVGRIVDLGDQTYLLSYTTSGRTTGSNGTCFFSFRSADNSTAAVNADGTGAVFYVCQYEEGIYPTSYIPTSGSAVTRNRDICLLDGVMQSYINTTNYGVHANYTIPYRDTSADSIPFYLTINGNLSTRNFVYHQASSANRFIHTATLTGGSFFEIDASYTTGSFKFASRIKSGDSLTAINGTLTNHSDTFTIPAFNDCGVGGQQAGINNVLIKVGSLIFFPAALTDSECEALTS